MSLRWLLSIPFLARSSMGLWFFPLNISWTCLSTFACCVSVNAKWSIPKGPCPADAYNTGSLYITLHCPWTFNCSCNYRLRSHLDLVTHWQGVITGSSVSRELLLRPAGGHSLFDAFDFSAVPFNLQCVSAYSALWKRASWLFSPQYTPIWFRPGSLISTTNKHFNCNSGRTFLHWRTFSYNVCAKSAAIVLCPWRSGDISSKVSAIASSFTYVANM